MQLGNKLAHRLKELKLTQTQLAEASGITQAAINKYIKNKSKPTYENILKLCPPLAVLPAWFFPDDVLETRTLQRKKSRQGDIFLFPKSRSISRHGKFVIGHYFPMQHLPPPSHALYAGIANNFYSLIFNGLIERVPPDNHPRAGLAIDWKPIENRWLFRLRDGVQFHDGTPLTAEDIVWSYEQYLHSNPQERQIQSVEIVDESVIAVHLRSQWQLGGIMTPRIMPKGMKQAPDQWIGTGPFQATALDPGFWRLKANDTYFFGKPYFDEVHIREFDSPKALEKALVSGEVHFAIGIDLSAKNLVTKVEADTQRYHLHFLDLQSHPLTSNHSFRRAVALSLDRAALARAAGFNETLFSAGPFDYLVGDRSPHPPYPADRQKAKLLLGQVEPLNEAVFRVQCRYTNNPREQALEAELVKQLNDLGIRAEASDPPDALLVTRNARFFESECRLWATDAPEAYNFNRYSNPNFDKQIREYLNSGVTPSQLIALRELIEKDVPDVSLFYHGIPLTYVKQLGALEGRLTLTSCLHDIHNWYIGQSTITDHPSEGNTFDGNVKKKRILNQ